MNKVFLILAILLLTQHKMNAQNISIEQAKPYLEAFQKQFTIPESYHFHSVQKIEADHAPAFFFRYQKDENKGMNGEHFSFIISERDKQVLGFTNMDKRYANLNMPSKSETERIAKAFLKKLDGSLSVDLENLWIDRHDEQIFVDSDKRVTIAGMKYKCYRQSTDDYAWVIVGFDGTIVTFERNIKWNMDEQRRITEKWLHDNWLIDHSSISMGKSALVLIETQNEWMHTEGKLNKALVTDKGMMSKSIANIEKALTYARKNNMEVIHVGLRFEKGYPELANGKSGLRKAIPTAGTFPINEFGSQFYDTVKPIEGEFIVTGRVGASGFTGSNLDAYLRNNKIENIYLAGYATHVCVESTLRDGHERSYNTYVISDATSAFNQTQQDYFLSDIVHHFGEHLSTQEFINE
ncbi:cysteine hydrolase [Sphingobacterium sp. ML3W]|uniref:cysteine hydrolase n=1 Tax=Sphingobacterium sp. ML3W TaxID=1538644 RepID=UPI00190F8B61|nr:cysteine hydrolase [Sphingobacterium sp. ML3W]